MALNPISSETLTRCIQHIVVKKHMTYLDAVLYLCDRRGWEPDIIAPHLGEIIKSKLSEDAQRLHFIPRLPQLPF